jgi:predicted site-specific integrase-resolvase
MSPALATDPLTRKQAAEYLGLSPVTLARWATTGRGPRYSRSGDHRGKCWYRIEDLDRWLRDRQVEPEQ